MHVIHRDRLNWASRLVLLFRRTGLMFVDRLFRLALRIGRVFSVVLQKAGHVLQVFRGNSGNGIGNFHAENFDWKWKL